MIESTERAIRTLEGVRCRCLIEQDFETLDTIIADDLHHIHSTGAVENKASYMQTIRTRLRFLEIKRPSIDVKVFENVAIATGPLSQVIQVRANDQILETTAVVTQIWIKQACGWVQSNFQSTRTDGPPESK
jgi:hypothetical protein